MLPVNFILLSQFMASFKNERGDKEEKSQIKERDEKMREF